MTTATSHRPPVAVISHIDNRHDMAQLLLRVTLGGLLLLHGISKINAGVAPIGGMLARAGLPSELALLVYVGEVLAPVLLIVGLWTRAAALVIVINMLVAVLLAHMNDLTRLTPQGGWALELQAFYIVTALALALTGAGRYSVGGLNGRWN